METKILVQRCDNRAGSFFKQMLPGDVGFDLEFWSQVGDEFYDIEPLTFASLHTGLKIKVGENSWGMVRPRSSTFVKRRLFVQEGTIDSGYTGDLFIFVFNPNKHVVRVKNGDRLGQLIPVPKFDNVIVEHVERMPVTQRGHSGFGSTGGFKDGQKLL